MSEKEIAITAARAAGHFIRRQFGRIQVVESKKSVIDLVTDTDRQAEAIIVSILQQAFPSYGILSEESVSQLGKAQESWLIDPLDGTTNYIHGYPLFAVSIALVRQDDVLLGVVYNPLTDELFVAEKGRGATLNGAPISVSATSLLANSLLASGFPYHAWETEEDNTREWQRFIKVVTSLRSDGSASLDLCHVACGRLDGYWELDLDPWDMAAGSLIVQEAGGKVTDRYGMPFTPYQRSVVASNGCIHEDMLSILNKEKFSH